MKAFAKVALGALGLAASTVAVTAPSSAQLPVGWCLNMPDDGTANPEEFGCNNPRGTDPRFGARTGSTSTDDGADVIQAVVGTTEPQA